MSRGSLSLSLVIVYMLGQFLSLATVLDLLLLKNISLSSGAKIPLYLEALNFWSLGKLSSCGKTKILIENKTRSWQC